VLDRLVSIDRKTTQNEGLILNIRPINYSDSLINKVCIVENS